MSTPALLFPGQGSQRVGMGADLCREFAVARETFQEADAALGEKLSELCFTGPEDRLTLTENAQPALLTTSLAVARVLAAEGGLVPQIAAGHSLGEWTALVVMAALDFGDAVRAVRSRGRFMQEAVAPGVGAMSALLGADLAAAEALCVEASQGDEIVVAANVNGAGQIVVSGHQAALARLEALASGRKVRAMRLKVSAPFHSPLMAPARERMAALLRDVPVRAPRGVVLGNVDGEPYGDADSVRERLCAQITGTVLWEACARGVAARTDRGIEAGPGRVLCGLFRRIAPEFRCVATDDVAGVRAALEGARA
ncbi:ACP S-malonyltransferase [Candidatus Binatia bacterium]|nr:ACP S-malonyltransferase [Candidatus Binatia bacterium]